MNKKIGAIIQARMNSKRFPGKVLYKLGGKPLLGYLLDGLRQCLYLKNIVVATSIEGSDTPIADYCRSENIPCYRGNLENVAGRFIGVLDEFRFDAFVRINGDSPLLDHRLVDKGIDIYNSGNFDIVTNVLKRTFPHGQSVEVVNSDIFKKNYPFMRLPEEREHITSYFYSHTDGLVIHNFESGKDYGDIQFSIDRHEDIKRLMNVLGKLEKPHWEYKYEDFLALI